MVKDSGRIAADEGRRNAGAAASAVVNQSAGNRKSHVFKVAAYGLRRNRQGGEVEAARGYLASPGAAFHQEHVVFQKRSHAPLDTLHPLRSIKKRAKQNRTSARESVPPTTFSEVADIYALFLPLASGVSSDGWDKVREFARIVKLIDDSAALSRAVLDVSADDLAAYDNHVAAYNEWLKALKPIAEAVDQESRELKAHVGHSDQASPLSVELETATGPLDYVLPLSLEETLSSSEVGELLSPSGKPNRALAQRRRQSNELLGVEISGHYRYPRFQIDALRRCIHPVVAYANSEMESSEDPWGTLDWWYTPDRILGGRPVDLVIAGELTEEAVDDTLAFGSRGMS